MAKMSQKIVEEIRDQAQSVVDEAENLIEMYESRSDYTAEDRTDAKYTLEDNLMALHNLHLKIKDE